ncbi:Sec-independent protein translocase protein TatB [Campylobacter corcagiensis]|uniref:Sec-independent protein translocase protein TatB homolog n=1 Tax=Campylobacter corcagiensis TaxID=1448857 RepID=A0A7M1LGE3_9BACT|nr:Sec-independent protein translocase protein TatB [Campylobacter corcagiensis]QKF64894.1 twin arginine translocation system, TatB protein [Campylobacter corcagiensis]QOQ86946.1 Sec-independent protein translocase subunit TatB [Campylobacter corcagiensis]
MFGMSFPEILVIAVIAVIALGPEKLPKTMVEIAKYLKLLKKTVNDAKASFDQEVRIAELKEDAKKYKDSISKTTQGVRKKLTFEELEDIKNSVNDIKSSTKSNLADIKKAVSNPTQLAKDKLTNSAKNFISSENKPENNAQESKTEISQDEKGQSDV